MTSSFVCQLIFIFMIIYKFKKFYIIYLKNIDTSIFIIPKNIDTCEKKYKYTKIVSGLLVFSRALVRLGRPV